MSNLLTVEGLLYRGCVWIYRVMILTFLWLLFNCAIITIGPSTIALFVVSTKLVRGEEVHLFQTFFKSFKSYFFKGLILSAMMYVFGLNIVLCFNELRLNLSILGLISVLNLVLIFEMVIILLYTLPLISRYDSSLFIALKNSFLIGNHHLFTSLTGCMLLLLAGFFYYLSPILFMIIGGGLFAFIWSWMLKRVLDRYEKVN